MAGQGAVRHRPAGDRRRRQRRRPRRRQRVRAQGGPDRRPGVAGAGPAYRQAGAPGADPGEGGNGAGRDGGLLRPQRLRTGPDQGGVPDRGRRGDGARPGRRRRRRAGVRQPGPARRDAILRRPRLAGPRRRVPEPRAAFRRRQACSGEDRGCRRTSPWTAPIWGCRGPRARCTRSACKPTAPGAGCRSSSPPTAPIRRLGASRAPGCWTRPRPCASSPSAGSAGCARWTSGPCSRPCCGSDPRAATSPCTWASAVATPTSPPIRRSSRSAPAPGCRR